MSKAAAKSVARASKQRRLIVILLLLRSVLCGRPAITNNLPGTNASKAELARVGGWVDGRWGGQLAGVLLASLGQSTRYDMMS